MRIQKVGESFVHKLAAPAKQKPSDTPAPVDPFAPQEGIFEPKMPGYGPALKPSRPMHPEEKQRLASVVDTIVNDKEHFVINVVYGDEGRDFAASLIAASLKSLPEQARPTSYRPREVDAAHYQLHKYAVTPPTLNALSDYVVGYLPTALPKLAYFGSLLGQDFFAPELQWHENDTILTHMGRITKFFADKKYNFMNPPPDIAAVYANIQPPEGTEWTDVTQIPLLKLKKRPEYVSMPIAWRDVLDAYKNWMDDDVAPMRAYANNIADLANRDPYTLNNVIKLDPKFARIPIQSQVAHAGQPIGYQEAAALFLAGKPVSKGVETIFIDLDNMTNENPYDEEKGGQRETGTLSATAKNSVMDMLTHAQQQNIRNRPGLVRENRKVVILSKMPIKSTAAGGKPQNIQGIRYYEIPSISNIEVVEDKLPMFLARNFFDPQFSNYAFVRRAAGEQEQIISLFDENGQITGDGRHAIAEIARFVQGFTFSGLDRFLAETIRKSASGTVAVGNRQRRAIVLEDLLAQLKNDYKDKLFTNPLLAQAKDQFEIWDPKQKLPQGMADPPEVASIIEDYRRVGDIEKAIDENPEAVSDLKSTLIQLGFHPEELGYKEHRDPQTPVGTPVWDEENDVNKLKKILHDTILTKKKHFLLLAGPPGMGKTSTAAAIATSLGYGLLRWKLGGAKKELVGQTGERISAAFRFLTSLKKHVIILDEINEVIGEKSQKMLDPGMQDIVGEFLTSWDMLKDAAVTNDLIIISTTNYIDDIQERMRRRLAGGGNEVVLDYLRDLKHIRSVVDVATRGYVDPRINGPQIKDIFAQALFREANDETKGSYSNDEIVKLFKAWVEMCRLIPRKAREMGVPIPDNIYDTRLLVMLVQRSGRQEKQGNLRIDDSVLDEFLSHGKPMQVTEPVPEKLTVPGYERVEVPQPPQAVPSAPGTQPSAAPAAPLAKDVKVEDEKKRAEDYLSPPAKPRKASSSIKLLSIAKTPHEQEVGLQFVKKLDDMSGILFEFQHPRVLSFWMKNTYIPLDIAFVDSDGKVVKTEGMVPLSMRTVNSGTPCVMALEVPAGTLKNLGANVGKHMIVDRKNNTVSFE
jgi:hypothetical protein